MRAPQAAKPLYFFESGDDALLARCAAALLLRLSEVVEWSIAAMMRSPLDTGVVWGNTAESFTVLAARLNPNFCLRRTCDSRG
jgi:hypothetical protein